MKIKCPKCGSIFFTNLFLYREDGRGMFKCIYCNHQFVYPPEKEPIEHKIVNVIMLLLSPVLLPLYIGLAVKNYITIKRIKSKLK